MDGMPRLHAVPRRLDHGIGRRHDMGRRTVVGGQVDGLRPVVGLEAPDELHRRSVESVDVLVVVADGEQGELARVVFQRAAGQRRYQLVLLPADILVLVDQNPPEAREQALAALVRLLRRQLLAAEQRDGTAHHVPEHLVVRALRPAGEAPARQAHGKRVAGEHRHAARVVADHLREPAADIDGGVTVVGEGEDAPGVLPPDADQPGDAVHQHARLARTGACEDQHVGPFPLVGHDALLDRVTQALDDGAPGGGRGLPADLAVPARQPAGEKLLLRECEVVHRQTQRLAHGREAALGELHHDVDLQHLSLVVKRQGLEFRPGEPTPVPPLQPDLHRRAEHRQPLVEADDLQLVEPEQGPVQQFGRVPHRALEHQVGLDRLQEFPERGLGKEIGATDPGRQAVEQMFEQAAGRLAA